jgi:hypothetical protein
MNRTDLIEMLRNNVCEVTFTKVDGSKRVMPCTLKEGVIPPYEAKGTPRTKTDAVLSVWCTDRAAWRSFRVDNVTEVKVL